MTNKEMEKTIQFILKHQAKFASGLQQEAAQQVRFISDIQQLREVQATTSGAIVTILDVVGRLATSQRELTEAHRQTELNVGELADRVNVFIAVVERHISGNDKPWPSA